MSTYNFPDLVCGKLGACDAFILKNIDWVDNYQGLSSDPITVNTTEPLTDTQLSGLTALLATYTDPAYWLVLDHTNNQPLHSHFLSDCIGIEDCGIMQTFIMEGTQPNQPIVMDSIKTILEFSCLNVQNFLNTTSGNISVEIFDITRNTSIATESIDIGSAGIATQWNTLAQTGITTGSILYKSLQFTGLMNKNPNYDTVWQLRGAINGVIGDSITGFNIPFDFRCNTLQQLFYNVE